MTTTATPRIKTVIAPSFYKVHRDIKAKKHSKYWLKGGRGSTKSSFISIEIILGMMKDPDANAVVLRKVKDTLRDSVYEQMLWAIDALGVTKYWHDSLNPLAITYIPTGQKIVFKGADKPKKVKSSKFRRGYTKFIWFEEADEFENMQTIRTINQSLVRGGEDIITFYSYNPPQSANNFINTEVGIQALREDTFVHSSTYLTVPPEWLGKEFILDAEHLKKTNRQSYDHEYMGIVTGTGAEVFTNIVTRRITDEEIATFDKVSRGIDYGFAADPTHYAEVYLYKPRRRLIIFREIHKKGMKNLTIAQEIKKFNPNRGLITAESAEPKTNAELRDLGLNVRGAKKGPGSVEFGIKYLQDLDEIIIDPDRTPNTYREFNGYEIERDSHGNLKGTYPDKDNHSIDAIRYALENEMKNGGGITVWK